MANIEELFGSNYTVDSLYQARSNIPAALDDFAKGMTYRMMSGPNGTLAYGLVLENMTYIQVVAVAGTVRFDGDAVYSVPGGDDYQDAYGRYPPMEIFARASHFYGPRRRDDFRGEILE